MIKAPEGGMQEIPSTQTMLETKHNPRGAPGSVSGRSAPGFGGSIGDSSGSYSDKSTKYPSLVSIIKPAIVSSKNKTKDPSHVPK